jgi:hypothetical protein
MTGIERKAIIADRRAIGSVREAAQAIVAWLAQASDRTGQELIVIALMRREMIGHGRRRDLAFRPA